MSLKKKMTVSRQDFVFFFAVIYPAYYVPLTGNFNLRYSEEIMSSLNDFSSLFQ